MGMIQVSLDVNPTNRLRGGHWHYRLPGQAEHTPRYSTARTRPSNPVRSQALYLCSSRLLNVQLYPSSFSLFNKIQTFNLTSLQTPRSGLDSTVNLLHPPDLTIRLCLSTQHFLRQCLNRQITGSLAMVSLATLSFASSNTSSVPVPPSDHIRTMYDMIPHPACMSE